jgi:hypothetical protein
MPGKLGVAVSVIHGDPLSLFPRPVTPPSITTKIENNLGIILAV